MYVKTRWTKRQFCFSVILYWQPKQSSGKTGKEEKREGGPKKMGNEGVKSYS